MLLTVTSWQVDFATDDGLVHAVRDVSFEVAAGQCFAVVGESGSGKSQLFQTLFGLGAKNAQLAGVASFDGVPLPAGRTILGSEVAFVFQDPLTSLTPHMTIGAQMVETLGAHGTVSHSDARARCLELLALCRIDDPALRFAQYPHQLSGGMRQRVMIAQAIAHRPKLLIADEPTTALDVTVQADVLDLLDDLRREFNMAVVLITHDMGVAARLADHVMVMRSGQCVEQGPVANIFGKPQQDYTRELLAVRRSPALAVASAPPDAAPFLTVDHVSAAYPVAGKWFGTQLVPVLHDISFAVAAGSCIAVVGESGSGKSTLARVVAGLLPMAGGDILLGTTRGGELNPQLVQTVFQDPLAALNPRQTVGASVREALDVLAPELPVAQRQQRARAVFDQVRLPQTFYDRYPHELSGGQCQRVCIARALLPQPKLLICDEAISALDATTAELILQELVQLKQSLGFTVLFITHDLQAAAAIADQVLVLQQGRVKEYGPAQAVFDHPRDPYTQALFRSALVADPAEMARRTAARRG